MNAEISELIGKTVVSIDKKDDELNYRANDGIATRPQLTVIMCYRAFLIQ